MSATNDLVRPLGMLEKLYPARQVLRIYHSVIVTATYTARSRLDDATIYSRFSSAIFRLLQRHPSLCCYYEGEDTPAPGFKRLQTIEVKDVLQILDLDKRGSLAKVLQDLHDEEWSTDRKALWKLVVMREAESSIGFALHIAFVYHHVIGDGLSGTAFQRSLLQELEHIERTEQDPQAAPTTIDIPVSVKLMEPVEKLISFPLSWSFLLKQVVQEYAPRWLIGERSPIWAGRPAQTLEECPYRTRVRLVTLEAAEVGDLLKECKQHSVTLTSLLTAVVVTALARALPEATTFHGTTPYTLRRVTGTSMNEMVNQSSAFNTDYPTDLLDRIRKASTAAERAERLWRTADYFHAQMQDELRRCPQDNLVGLLPYVSDYVNFYRKKIGRAREGTFEVSNLGVFKMNSDTMTGSWRPKSMTFTEGAQPVGTAFSVTCVSVEDGPLTMAITWQDSVIEEGIVDVLAHDLTELGYLLREERS